jgi:TrmH family RNA methyltransferase
VSTKLIKVFTENNDFQRFIVLKNNRNKRHRYGEFFVEGVRNINEAIKNEWNISALLYSREKPLSDWAKNILQDYQDGFRFELLGPLMKQLSDKEDTSEIIAIVKMPEDNLSRIRLSDDFLIVVFDRPSSKGNLGSIIRSCDALGAQGLVVTGHAVDLYEPEVVRASTGSFFKLPLVRLPSFVEFTEWVARLKIGYPQMKIVGASEKGQMDIDQQDFTGPTILLIGNETDGLTWNYEKISDVLVRIPMAAETSASSLNAACAASIFLYEISRQRRNELK